MTEIQKQLFMCIANNHPLGNLRWLAQLTGVMFVLCADSAAQVWEQWVRRYDGPAHDVDCANSIVSDAWGNIHVTGWSTGRGSYYDFATLAYNSSGMEMLVVRGERPSYDKSLVIAGDESGNVYAAGYSFRGGGLSGDYLTVKYNRAGALLWSKTYGGSGDSHDEVLAIAVDSDENVYVTGRSDGNGTSADFVTIKYDSTGIEQWVAIYNGPGNGQDEAYGIALDGEGSVYVTGRSLGGGTSYDYATIKYSSDGDTLWVVRYNGPGNGDDVGRDLVVDNEGFIYVTGWSWGDGSNYDYATIKYSPSGDSVWIARYNPVPLSNDLAKSLAVDADQNVYVTGESDTSGYDFFDYATVKYNFFGFQVWEVRYTGQGGQDRAVSIALDAERNVYVTGTSWGISTTEDCVTVGYDSTGNERWVVRYDGPEHQTDEGREITLDADGNVYVAGYSMNAETQFDYLTLKYSETPPIAVEMSQDPINAPITIPASGGRFSANLTITNNEPFSLTFDLWTAARTPQGNWLYPILGPMRLTLAGGDSLTRTYSQEIPYWATAGVYLYEARLGDYPDVLFAFDNFELTKLLADEGTLASSCENDRENLIGWCASYTAPAEARFAFDGACPNPFNPVTTLSFELPEAGWVALEVFDVAGRSVRAQHAAPLHEAWLEAGTHSVAFDGSALSSGVYLCRLKTEHSQTIEKVLLLK